MMRGPALVLTFLLVAGNAVRAAKIAENELARAPSAKRIAGLQAEAAYTGWGAVARQLRGVAVGLYEKQKPQAQAWYYLYRWADFFSLTETQAGTSWSSAVMQAKAGNANHLKEIRTGQHKLADFWPAGLRTYAMASPDFSDQFFTLLSPRDQPPMVMSILAGLWSRFPAEFKDYANLALAIAVVYDTPPPPDWPHAQVSPEALPRRLPPPADVFAFFVRSDQLGAMLQHLRQLPASELKFVVDTSAAFDDMVWAQRNVETPLSQLAKVYDAIHYRKDRVEGGAFMWPQPTYRLPDILQEGGLCVDQAYFAAMVGKAKGVPTLLFRGAGLNGWHAWFGFLDGNGRWQLDCGRYADQKFVAGFAFDPQTWTNISDHELMFLTEGFRRLPLFRTSRMHTQFAEVYFAAGDFPAAAKAARTAVNIESRNLDAWNLLIGAQARRGTAPTQYEALLREAARAFQRYPEVEIAYKAMLSRSLRARGETSAADFVERSTAEKYAANREDLSVKQAQEILQRSKATGDTGNHIRTFYDVLQSFGNGAGMDFFANIVRPFVEDMLKSDQPWEAVHAVEQARHTLRVEPNSQLELEINALAERAHQALK